jgi:hypothetical protein
MHEHFRLQQLRPPFLYNATLQGGGGMPSLLAEKIRHSAFELRSAALRRLGPLQSRNKARDCVVDVDMPGANLVASKAAISANQPTHLLGNAVPQPSSDSRNRGWCVWVYAFLDYGWEKRLGLHDSSLLQPP